ncbi:translation initiation factor IF-2, partial [bacterium]|nr:translation initiation factor IF-2 [bacterium]
EQREERIKDQKARGGDRVVNLESLFAKVEKGKLKELKLVVKADVHGSLIAIAESLEKIQKEDVRVRVIHSGVGAVSEGDIMLASAAEAIIICFHVRADGKTMRLAEDEKVEIRSYKIIYQAIEEIEKAITGMLTPKYKEVVLGRATIREVFSISKVGKIAGSFVESGKIIRGKQARLIRDGVEVFDGKVDNLNRFQETVSEVLSGYECGINLAYNDVKISDVVEVYEMEEIPRDA